MSQKNESQKSKVDTLVGFAIKAKKIVFGADNLDKRGQKKHLIIICPSISQNTKKSVILFADKYKIPILQPKKQLSEIVFRDNCKVVALLDKQMAEAIISNNDESYVQVVTEVF